MELHINEKIVQINFSKEITSLIKDRCKIQINDLFVSHFEEKHKDNYFITITDFNKVSIQMATFKNRIRWIRVKKNKNSIYNDLFLDIIIAGNELKFYLQNEKGFTKLCFEDSSAYIEESELATLVLLANS